MRKIYLFVFLFVTTAVFSMPLISIAGGNEGSSQHSVCDPLKNEGVTKGLYGLCVAYCEAGASERVLDNYKRKMGPGDPGMPSCRGDLKPEEVECPCWGTERLANASIVAPPNYCFLVFDSEVLVYSTAVYGGNIEVNFEIFGDTAGTSCRYTGPDGFSVETTTPEQQSECQSGLESLVGAGLDFEFCYQADQ